MDYCNCCNIAGTPDEVPCPPFASVFDNFADELTRVADMPSNTQPAGYAADSSRWYPTTVTMPWGNVLVAGGDRWVDNVLDLNCEVDDPGDGFPKNRTWLEFDPGDQSWSEVSNLVDSTGRNRTGLDFRDAR